MQNKKEYGDWGLGIGDWAQSPIPNPQSPIPNPQSPLFLLILHRYNIFLIKMLFNFKFYLFTNTIFLKFHIYRFICII